MKMFIIKDNQELVSMPPIRSEVNQKMINDLADIITQRREIVYKEASLTPVPFGKYIHSLWIDDPLIEAATQQIASLMSFDRPRFIIRNKLDNKLNIA